MSRLAPHAQPRAAAPSILEALADRRLFSPAFQPAGSWRAWHAFLAALFGLPLTEAQRELYRRHTGRQMPPGAPAREGWLVVGRRGGKSRIAGLVAIYLASFRDYSAVLAPGERGVVMVIAADRRQARVVFRYITGLLDGIPVLARMVEGRTADAIDLGTRVTIEVHTASFRAVRGYTIIGAICDEVSFWRSEESANPDVEIIGALRPGMTTIPGAVLLGLSTPYARRGLLWDMYRQHYGQDGDPILVWQASTSAMNPTVDERVIAEAYGQDEVVAAAEYGAQFRRDIETFVSREAVEAAVIPDRRELPPALAYRHVGFVDPSGGSSDAMTLAIAHVERDRVILDLVRERRPPFSPEDATAEFAEVLKRYRLGRVIGDAYSGEWVREQFRKHGIHYQVADRPKSALYTELLPFLNSGKVQLLDDRRLVTQLCNLERRTARSGKDSVDHGPGGHDDLINSAAGALVTAWGMRRRAGWRGLEPPSVEVQVLPAHPVRVDF